MPDPGESKINDVNEDSDKNLDNTLKAANIQIGDDGEFIERPGVRSGKGKSKANGRYILDRPVRRLLVITLIVLLALSAGFGISALINRGTTAGSTPDSAAVTLQK